MCSKAMMKYPTTLQTHHYTNCEIMCSKMAMLQSWVEQFDTVGEKYSSNDISTILYYTILYCKTFLSHLFILYWVTVLLEWESMTGMSCVISPDKPVLFVRSLLRAGVQPTLDPSAETFMSVQCASPGRGGELVGVCGVCASCVGWRKG